jgi:NADPH-dependent ferric siderophore reductase
MSFIKTVSKVLLRKALIIEKAQISLHVYHIRIQSVDLTKISYQPGYYIRVFCGTGEDAFSRKSARSYSIWNFNPADQSIDLAVDTHPGGTGADWAKRCQTGHTVHFTLHKGEFLIDRMDEQYLLIGDLSTVAHYYAIKRHLPVGKHVDSLIYSDRGGDFFSDLDGLRPLHFYTVTTNPTDAIIERLTALFLKPPGKCVAYVGGDSRVCEEVRRYFLPELWKDERQIRVKAFWGPGTE